MFQEFLLEPESCFQNQHTSQDHLLVISSWYHNREVQHLVVQVLQYQIQLVQFAYLSRLLNQIMMHEQLQVS